MDSPYDYFSWYKTNFNMPVPPVWDGSTFVRYLGRADVINESYSYNLSGFSPGFEICVGLSVYDFENDGVDPYYINTQMYQRWTDPSLNTIFWNTNGDYFTSTLLGGYYSDIWYAANIGCAGWDVNSNATYHFRASCSGSPSIGTVDSGVSMSNVPSTTQMSSDKAGYIWVEGNNLCYVNANLWKHTIIGDIWDYAGADPGYIWIDTDNVIHWTGADGNDYQLKWRKKQFDSIFNNSATSTDYAGTSKAGIMWVDDEYGWTHLSYIGYDGYKYVTGAGDDPYTP